MGSSLTKTPLERRNTIVRRTQRKSIHKIKDKVDNIYKDIKKFNGIDEDSIFIEIKSRLELLQRDLEIKSQELQPQVRYIHGETSKKIKGGFDYLNDKMIENQEKAAKKAEEDAEKAAKQAEKDAEKAAKEAEKSVIKYEADSDVVFTEDVEEDPLAKRRSNVDLHVIQIEPQVELKRESKRASFLKLGVPVLPGSIRESLFKKSAHQEELINNVRKEIEAIELEISQFIGQRNGRRYTRLFNQLEACRNKLQFETSDDAIKEQLKLCNSYISSCVTFLEEKATDVVDGDNETDDEVFQETENFSRKSIENLSPRSVKATYV